MNKEEIARRSGIAYAYTVIKQAQDAGCSDSEAIEKLINEIKYRNITKVPISITEAEMNRFCADTKANCVTTFKLMTCLTLHDEFGFGYKRLNRFMERFKIKAESLADDYATWADYQQALWEECKIKIDVKEEFLKMTGRDKK